MQTLMQQYGIGENFARLAMSRGVTDKSAAERFFHPTPQHLFNPYLLDGMQEAVERIERAVEEGESILIYGDYDCDGICASLILKNFLFDVGVEAAVYLPERDDGYGISLASCAVIVEKYAPNLIITVDCGISSAREIEYLKERGIDVVVTDHHELPNELPNCVVINPKLSASYPFRELCGAGVALKLVAALTGGDVESYMDLAAIATLADSVPLVSENRVIVKIGLAEMAGSDKPYLAAYREKIKKRELKSDDILYYLVPCINAAGRMGNVFAAFDFMQADCIERALTLCDQLFELNLRRRECCEEGFKTAEQCIADKNAHLIVSVCDVPRGVLGIVASRLSETYFRPAFVFCRDKDMLTGSGRSVEGVNLHNMLSHASSVLVGFGGHEMAAGASLYFDDIDQFRELCCEYLKVSCADHVEKVIGYDFENGDFSASEVELFEPYGTGFPRPRVLTRLKNADYFGFGKSPSYIKIKTDVLPITTFCGEKYVDALSSGGEILAVSEINVNVWKGDRNAELRLVDVLPAEQSVDGCAELCRAKFLEQLFFGGEDTACGANFLTALDNALASPFGTCITAADYGDVQYFNENLRGKLKNADNIINTDCGAPLSPRGQNTLSLGGGASVGTYQNVFFLYSPPSGFVERLSKSGLNVFALDRKSALDMHAITTDRQTFIECYKRLLTVRETDFGSSLIRWHKIFTSHGMTTSLAQFTACMLVFMQLKLVRLDKTVGTLRICSSNGVNLDDSPLYKSLIKRGC